MLGIEQYEQNAGKAESEDMVSTLLEALYEDDEGEDTDTESLLSINNSACAYTPPALRAAFISLHRPHRRDKTYALSATLVL